MNITKLLFLYLSLVFGLFSAHAQEQFRNLDFESATLIAVPNAGYGRVLFGPAFPGWTGYINDERESYALYNNLFISSAGIGLYGFDPTSNFNPIQGKLTALLEAGSVL